MMRKIRLLPVCLLALAGCMGEYRLIVEDQGSQNDGGAGQSGGDGDGDGDGDTGDGDGDPGDGDGDPGDGDGDPGDGDGDNQLSVCRRGGLCQALGAQTVDKVDVLFMVDNSSSMEQEQASLRNELRALVDMLTSGDSNQDGVQDFPPAKDLHFGVVSSDLGLPGLESAGIDRCLGLGDRGELRNVANPELAAMGMCSNSTYTPPYLAYSKPNDDDPVQLANDLSCISTLGIDGCGFEQQLESMLKAIWPGHDQSITFVTDSQGFGMLGNGGPGFPNGDFIRNDPSNPSVIALVMVTDEEDCSSHRMDHFIPSASPNGVNTRCFFESQRGEDSNLFQVERYIELFKMLRPGREELVLFNAIVGVPQRLTVDDVNLDDEAARDAFYDAILDAPEMQERINDMGTPDMPEDDGLVPSCDRGEAAKAYPPRRIVRVAQGMGAGGLVQSICEDDFATPIKKIAERIGTRLGARCLPAELERVNGRVACDVYWTMPHSGVEPPCNDFPFLTSAGSSGGVSSGRCRMNQVPVLESATGTAPTQGMLGFFYDDFSDEVAAGCGTGRIGARIAFTAGVTPPPGTTITLDCDP